MRCNKVKNLLMDYAAEDLPESVSKQVREHLAACRRCRAELEIARRASEALTLLSHQEEPQVTVRVPSHGVPRYRRPRLRAAAALILAVVVLVVGGIVLHSLKKCPPVALVDQPADTGISPAPEVPSAPEPAVVHPEEKPVVHTPRVHVTQKSASPAEPQQEQAAEDDPADACGLIESAMMMVSISRSPANKTEDDSYSYEYTEYDPESGATIECKASRKGNSIEIRLHSNQKTELSKGDSNDETDVENNSNLLLCAACGTDTARFVTQTE